MPKAYSKEEIKTAAINAGLETLKGAAAVVHPAFGITVAVAASLFGSAIERRRERAEDMIRFVSDSIDEFSNSMFESEAFQDGFVFLFEKYIRERNDDKRIILQQILLGYIKAPNLLDYPLEEMAEVLNRIRMEDVETLGHAFREEARVGIRADGRRFSFMLKEDPNSVSRLIYLGLLHEDRAKNGPQVREYDDKNYLFVWISPTGREFAKHLGIPPIEPALVHSVYF